MVTMFIRILLSVIYVVLLTTSTVFCQEQTASSSLKSPQVTTSAKPSYYLEISISRNLLTLFEKRAGSEPTVAARYTVGTVVRGLKTYPLGWGKVTGITFNPWWYPTEYSRQVFRGRGIELPQAVPPGDPLNYMGAFKISLSHSTWKGAIYRIHGNNNPNRVGRRVTGGCFVMHNEEGLSLARRIKVGTEVHIVP
jgi:lipoprotein-anchoring transpeptidase ErfK/SrfK